MTKTKKIDPIRKSLDLNCPIDHAFNVFTDKMNLWWPLKTHSCFEENSATVMIEKRVGGSVIETSNKGETNLWGKVLAWEPPNKLVMTWHPANSENLATKLTVNFDKLSDQKTKVSIFHEGWEIRTDDADIVHRGYDAGWDIVLNTYKSKAEKT